MLRIRHTFVAVAAVALSSAAYCGTPQWSVAESHGAVRIDLNGNAVAIKAGMPVPMGAVVTTGINGTVTLVRGDDQLSLTAGSRVRVADPAPTRGLVQFIAYEGTAHVRTAPGATRALAISTPYLAAMGTAAAFSVHVSGEGTEVLAQDGSVRVATLDGLTARTVAPGNPGLVLAGKEAVLLVGAEVRDARREASAIAVAYNEPTS